MKNSYKYISIGLIAFISSCSPNTGEVNRYQMVISTTSSSTGLSGATVASSRSDVYRIDTVTGETHILRRDEWLEIKMFDEEVEEIRSKLVEWAGKLCLDEKAEALP